MVKRAGAPQLVRASSWSLQSGCGFLLRMGTSIGSERAGGKSVDRVLAFCWRSRLRSGLAAMAPPGRSLVAGARGNLAPGEASTAVITEASMHEYYASSLLKSFVSRRKSESAARAFTSPEV